MLRRPMLAAVLAAFGLSMFARDATATIGVAQYNPGQETLVRHVGFIDNLGGPPALPWGANRTLVTGKWAWCIHQDTTGAITVSATHQQPAHGTEVINNPMGTVVIPNIKAGPYPKEATVYKKHQTSPLTPPALVHRDRFRVLVHDCPVQGRQLISIYLDHFAPGAEPPPDMGPAVPCVASSVPEEGEGTVALVDCNMNGVDDAAESDCNGDTIPDDCQAPVKGAVCGPYACFDMSTCEAALFTRVGHRGPNGTSCGTAANCAGIPAVSEWGLVALTLVMLAAGTVVLRRRVVA